MTKLTEVGELLEKFCFQTLTQQSMSCTLHPQNLQRRLSRKVLRTADSLYRLYLIRLCKCGYSTDGGLAKSDRRSMTGACRCNKEKKELHD